MAIFGVLFLMFFTSANAADICSGCIYTITNVNEVCNYLRPCTYSEFVEDIFSPGFADLDNYENVDAFLASVDEKDLYVAWYGNSDPDTLCEQFGGCSIVPDDSPNYPCDDMRNYFQSNETMPHGTIMPVDLTCITKTNNENNYLNSPGDAGECGNIVEIPVAFCDADLIDCGHSAVSYGIAFSCDECNDGFVNVPLDLVFGGIYQTSSIASTCYGCPNGTYGILDPVTGGLNCHECPTVDNAYTNVAQTIPAQGTSQTGNMSVSNCYLTNRTYYNSRGQFYFSGAGTTCKYAQ